jgi:hypothetical protein
VIDQALTWVCMCVGCPACRHRNTLNSNLHPSKSLNPSTWTLAPPASFATSDVAVPCSYRMSQNAWANAPLTTPMLLPAALPLLMSLPQQHYPREVAAPVAAAPMSKCALHLLLVRTVQCFFRALCGCTHPSFG